MEHNNIITMTDSYKLCHWRQYAPGTEVVYSYFESRPGAKYPYTVFFGLQYLLKRYMTGAVVDIERLKRAYELSRYHFGNDKIFNYDGWLHVLRACDGRLPVRIKAVPEGTPVPTGNVLMTVENTDPACGWLTNALESLLTHVWYPSTVATQSRVIKQMVAGHHDATCGNRDGLDFKLHDFGYRGTSSDESARIGGAAHLVNFLGTDTVPAIEFLADYYNADLGKIAYSVPATEHSVMTSLGKVGEADMVRRALCAYPTGIVSVVADSYDIYNFVESYVCREFRDVILERDGVFVVRPDSPTPEHPTPYEQVVWIVDTLWRHYGGTITAQGYRELDPHVRVLWGDGIDGTGIDQIYSALAANGYAASCIATNGMGGALLQRVNRDTQRFAFKCSAQRRSGVWHDVCKQPRDVSKASKAGRLALIRTDTGYETIRVGGADVTDELVTVFENGELRRDWTLDEIRARAVL